jgi:hypothetical protein
MSVRGDLTPAVALIYDDDAYVEAGGGASGQMGRQVAGRSFLDAYLTAALLPGEPTDEWTRETIR